MWNQKIGISVGNHYDIPTTEVIRMVQAIGFDAISPEYIEDASLAEIVHTARNVGLLIQSLHAPFGKTADLWSEDEKICAPAKQEILSALHACAKFEIPILVMHTWIGFDYQFNEDSLNFRNFEQIVDEAQALGIRIAFENTEGEEYLFALMSHFAGRDTVGFCWDSGHEMCYNHSQNLLSRYGDRLLTTHLNDNLGISRFDGKIFWTDDLHLLPYDGIADWDDAVTRLKKSRQMDILNFELTMYSKPDRHENDIYAQMDIQQYFTEAYKRACRIAYRYSR